MNDKSFDTHTLDLTELYRFLGWKGGGSAYNSAANATRRLVGRVVEIETIEDGEKVELIQFPFLSKAHYKLKGDGTVSLRLNDAAAPYLLNIAGNYTEVEFGILMTFQSFYSCRLYEVTKCELNKSHKRRTQIIVELDKLRDVFGIETKEYQVFGNFSERVLKPAVKEVTKKSDIDITFTTKRVGRKVGKIVFTISRTPGAEIMLSKTSFAPGSKKRSTPHRTTTLRDAQKRSPKNNREVVRRRPIACRLAHAFDKNHDPKQEDPGLTASLFKSWYIERLPVDQRGGYAGNHG